MTTLDDLRRICDRLPGAVEGSGDQFGYSVPVKGKYKGFIWSWNEKIDPKKPKVPNLRVLAVMVRSETEKEIILGSDSTKYFTEPHYNGFPAVLVNLDAVTPDEIQPLIEEAWRIKAPKDLIQAFDERQL